MLRAASAMGTPRAAGGGAKRARTSPALGEARAAAVREALLQWYTARHRALPWRAAPSETQAADARALAAAAAGEGEGVAPGAADERAYAVWVSEVMLQQTQVERVKEYFTRWIGKWPTVQALASASEDEVTEAWAGLGYYRRAKYLHTGAKGVSERLGGRMPRTAAELRTISGVGEYTAGAIASIAFGEAVAAVDANVVRVVSRLAAYKGRGKSGAEKEHWALAEELVSPERPGDLNQSIMELGATVCQAAKVQCGRCPVVAHCGAAAKAKESGGAVHVTDYPARAAKKAKRQELVGVLLVAASREGERSLLLSKRPESGLLAGLWEFPSVALASGESVGAATPLTSTHHKALRAHASAMGVPGNGELRHCGVVSHTFSHVQQHYVIYTAEVADDVVLAGGARKRWVAAREVAKAGLSSGPLKCFDKWTAALSQKRAM